MYLYEGVGTLRALKLYDTTRAGFQYFPDTDPPLNGWTMCLDPAGTDPPTQNNCVVTGQGPEPADGRATWQDVTYGDYQICEYPPAGQEALWHATLPPAGTSFPACRQVTLDERDLTFKFKNWKDGTIRVEKFNDLNGDGVRQEGEGPLEGFEFTVADTNCGTLVTDANGQASCTSPDIRVPVDCDPEEDEGCEPYSGIYQVCETPKAGWQLTGAYWGDDADPQGQSPGPCVNTGALDVSGGVDWTVKFGNRQLGSIIVQKVLASTGRGTNPTSGGPFNFTIQNTKGRTGKFSLNLGEKKEFIHTLPPDTYTITEGLATLPTNWVFRSAACEAYTPDPALGKPQQIGNGAVSNQVSQPVAGDEWLCTFGNDRYPYLSVTKVVSGTDEPPKGWDIEVRLNGETVASGTTGNNGTWSAYLPKVSSDPSANTATYQICERGKMSFIPVGAQYSLVGGSISGNASLSPKNGWACFPLEMGYNEDWTVVLRNRAITQTPLPIPFVGPLGLVLGALGLGWLGIWRVRRMG